MMFSFKEKDLKYVISLDGLKIKDIGNTGAAALRRNTFMLFNSDGRNISKVF